MQLRLQRLYRGATIKEATHTILVPRPMTAPVGGKPVRDRAVLDWARMLLDAVVGDSIPAAAASASPAAASAGAYHPARVVLRRMSLTHAPHHNTLAANSQNDLYHC